MDLIEARQLSRTYHAGARGSVDALQDVSLGIPTGSFTLLTGPSGSGKTTLLALLGALERPTSGQVLFAGRDLAKCGDAELARLRRQMGFIFQNFALIDRLPIWENITYPLIPRGITSKERLRIATELLTRFQLADRLGALPSELSGGEQQRVGLARALAGQPEVVLADEPTSNLDEQASQLLTDLLRRVHCHGTTVIVASHEPRFRELATQTARLAGGRLVELRLSESGHS